MSKSNGELKIEKGVPVPPETRGSSKGFRDAMRKLKVGDSVVLPGRSGVASAVNVLGPGNYRSRKEGDGYRIWRIK